MAPTQHVRPSVDEGIQFVPYDPGWPGQAEDEIDRLRAALGRRSRGIEHIGSTAVPGMVAKPIIDLQVSVVSAADAAAAAHVLAGLGYEDLGEAGVRGRRYLRRRQPPFPANVHLVWNRTLWRDNLALRDYLRGHPSDAGDYGRRKREILALGAATLRVYSDAKAPLLKEPVARASRRAERPEPG